MTVCPQLSPLILFRLALCLSLLVAAVVSGGCSGRAVRYQGVKGGGVNSTTASDGSGVMLFQQRAMATHGRRETLSAVSSDY
jgi:hypothetical protein